MRRHAHPWHAYVGVFLATLGLAWSVTSAWFELRERVRLLERNQEYLHGNVGHFSKETK